MKAFILVATFKGKTWVIENADYDLDWETQAQGHISNKEAKFTYDRAMALMIAHNVQRKSPTEGGVWEVFLKSSKEDTSPENGTAKAKDTKAKKPGPKSAK